MTLTLSLGCIIGQDYSTTEQPVHLTRLDQSNVLDWKVSSILLKPKFIISHMMFKYRCRSSIWFSLSIFELNPIVHEISPLKNIDDVIPLEPKDSPLNIPRYFSFAFQRQHLKIWSVSVKNWLSYESNDKERICIYLATDSKSQRDLQFHMIFYMTSKSCGLVRSLWPNCD